MKTQKQLAPNQIYCFSPVDVVVGVYFNMRVDDRHHLSSLRSNRILHLDWVRKLQIVPGKIPARK